MRAFLLALLAGASAAAPAHTICTTVADAATGQVLLEQGDCATRVTPASTFKIAIAAMGFDAGILQDAHTPVLPYKQGYVDWGGAEWTQPADPTRWLKYSVVWYSQQVAHKLGARRFHRYAERFGYGNADVSGDPGKHNGLDFSWIGSSLRISPREQLGFLRRIVDGSLPVSAQALAHTREVVETFPAAGGWTIQGKTGSARAHAHAERERPYGWFVGWANKGDRTLVFARLIQDDQPADGPAGLRARAAFLAEAPALFDRLTTDRPDFRSSTAIVR
ncbi:MAG: class D beta-lactamase [Telluria sp.]